MAVSDKYLELLSERYPTLQSAASEIINLEAILRLPKGTEHFLSDLHGEYGAFCHLMNNASGIIRDKVDMLFSKDLPIDEREEFATLIYYPKQVIETMKNKNIGLTGWYKITLYRLVDVCRAVASKYTRSKVRKMLPEYCGYVIEELLNVDRTDFNKEEYYNGIFDTIIELGRAEAFVISLTTLIKNLAVDHLHIVGDMFDRGESPDLILDLLAKQHSLDIQWGNHDILWMGAGMGQEACITNVVEISLKYGNSDLLENGYGISLRELAFYADTHIDFDKRFAPSLGGKKFSQSDIELIAKMRKAIFFIMIKVEGETVLRHPEYNMDSIIHHVNFENCTVEIAGEIVPLKACDFVTVNKQKPIELTPEEKKVIDGLKKSFLCSEKLRRHVEFLTHKGSLYKVFNGNLIFHGCIPLNKDGTYAAYKSANGKSYAGKDYMDFADTTVRKAFAAYMAGKTDVKSLDFCWYLWCGVLSPLFGREKMTTFERLYVEDERFHVETKNSYYKYCLQKEFCEKLLADFGAEGEHCHIINGHIPVKQIEGESPIKADGKLLVIDGGFCRAYHKKTGIAGYTLTYNSYGLRLSAHEPFTDIETAIAAHSDIHSNVTVFEKTQNRITVSQTDTGKDIKARVEDLKQLVNRYLKQQS